MDIEKMLEGINKILPIDESREPIHPFNQHQYLRREGFRKGVEWALEQVKNNGVLDDVINLFPSYDEALEEAQKTYLSKHVSEGVELYEEKAFMKGCNFIAQKVIGNNL